MLPITQMPTRHRYAGRLRPIAKIVIHDMEAAETATTAEAVARYFATTSRAASAHYNVDCDSITQSVADRDTAFHCPGSNADGIGIEHAGYASQTAAQWDDDYSRAMLELSARLTASLALRHGIPARWLTDTQIRAGARGFHTHADATRAFGTAGGHTDPGPGFPRAAYIERVRRYMATPDAGPVTKQTPTPAVVLDLGSTGSVVTALQKFALRVFPSYAGPIVESGGADGVYGAGTAAWVRDYQRRSHISADGIVGPVTWAHLLRDGLTP